MKTIEMDPGTVYHEYAKSSDNESFYNTIFTTYTQNFVYQRLNASSNEMSVIFGHGVNGTNAKIVQAVRDPVYGLKTIWSQTVQVTSSGSERNCSVFFGGGYLWAVFWCNNGYYWVMDAYRRPQNDYQGNFTYYPSSFYSNTYGYPAVFWWHSNTLWAYTAPLYENNYKVYVFYVSDGIVTDLNLGGKAGTFLVDFDYNRLCYLYGNKVYQLYGDYASLLGEAPSSIDLTTGTDEFLYGFGYILVDDIIRIIANCKPTGMSSGLYAIWMVSNSLPLKSDKPTFQRLNDKKIVFTPRTNSEFLYYFENYMHPVFDSDLKKLYCFIGEVFYKLPNVSEVSNTYNLPFVIPFPEEIYVSGRSISSNYIHSYKTPQISKTEAFEAEGVIGLGLETTKFQLRGKKEFKHGYVYPFFRNNGEFITWGQVESKVGYQNGWEYQFLNPLRYSLAMNSVRSSMLYADGPLYTNYVFYLRIVNIMNPHTICLGNQVSSGPIDLQNLSSGINAIKIYKYLSGMNVYPSYVESRLYTTNQNSQVMYMITDMLDNIVVDADSIKITENYISKYILYGSSTGVSVTKDISTIGVVKELSYPWVSSVQELQTIADSLSSVQKIIKFKFQTRLSDFKTGSNEGKGLLFTFERIQTDPRFKLLDLDMTGATVYTGIFYLIDHLYDPVSDMYEYRFCNTLFGDNELPKPIISRIDENRSNLQNVTTQGLKYYPDQRYSKSVHDYVVLSYDAQSFKIRFDLENNTLSRVLTDGSYQGETNNLSNVFIPSDASAIHITGSIFWGFFNPNNYAVFRSPKYSLYTSYESPPGVSNVYTHFSHIIPLTENTSNGKKSFIYYLGNTAGQHYLYLNVRGWFK